MRDTRGQILILMERWAEAIDELEIALRDMKNEPHVHRSLALAYEHLGDTTLAKLHADKAGDLATKPEHGG